jgi:hypothetical protein
MARSMKAPSSLRGEIFKKSNVHEWSAASRHSTRGYIPSPRRGGSSFIRGSRGKALLWRGVDYGGLVGLELGNFCLYGGDGRRGIVNFNAPLALPTSARR